MSELVTINQYGEAVKITEDSRMENGIYFNVKRPLGNEVIDKVFWDFDFCYACFLNATFKQINKCLGSCRTENKRFFYRRMQ